MDSIIFEKAIKLKEEIDNHPLILQLNKIEKTMEDNKEVIALYFAKEKAISDYNFALSHFKSLKVILVPVFLSQGATEK